MPALNHAQPHRAKAMPRLLSIKQATFELGLSRTSTYELIADGKLKTVKIGRRAIFLSQLTPFAATQGRAYAFQMHLAARLAVLHMTSQAGRLGADGCGDGPDHWRE
jgi:excisionase family DNA binding protein